MLKTITALVVAGAIAVTPVPKKDKQPEYVNAGEYRISIFCQYCNEQEGFKSASGKHLKYGYVAMNGVPFGTKISIDGEPFEVADRVGVPNTVDIFIPSDKGYCTCNTLEYKTVYIKQ